MFTKRVFPLLSIVLTAVFLYLKTFFYELTYLDDNVWLLDYHWYLANIEHFKEFFIYPDLITKFFYRPLLNASFMLNAFISGQELWSYRLSNLGLHITNSWLLFILLKRMNYGQCMALFFSLIFTVHPTLVQAVVWIPGRTDSLLAFFILLSFISFDQYLKLRDIKSLCLHLALWLMALLSKETAIVLPVMCWAYYLMVPNENFKKGKLMAPYAGWAVVGMFWLAARSFILRDSLSISIGDMVRSIWANQSALLSYLGKVLLPFNQSVLPIIKDTTLVYGCLSIVFLIILLALSKNARCGIILFGFIWFVMFLLPSLVLSFIIHEYRLYLPMIGIMIVVMECLRSSVGEGLPAPVIPGQILGGPGKPSLTVFTLGAIIVLFAILNMRFSEHYSDRMTFWRNAVQTSPHSALAQRNLGAMHYLDQRFALAEKRFKKSLSINPNEKMNHNNLGLIYFQRREFKNAENELLEEIRINPNYDNAYYNLGLIYEHTQNWQQAVEQWKKTIQKNPKYIQAYYKLANFYLQTNQRQSMDALLSEMKQRGISIPANIEPL